MMFSIKNCNRKKSFLATCTAIVLSSTVATASIAAANDLASVKKEFDHTYNKLLDNPSDVDLTMRYANLAIELEDYEAAVPPLERILMFNPELTSVKHKLGVMYYKLHSYEMASTYFKELLSNPKTPQDLALTAQKFLDGMPKK